MLRISVDIKFIIIFIISFSVSYVQGDDIANMFFYMLSIMLILSLIFCYIYYKKVYIEVNVENRDLLTNENINIKVILKNNSNMFIPYLVVYSSQVHGVEPKEFLRFAVTLHRKEEKVLENNVTFYRRGFCEIGKFTVEIKDLFGIITICKTIDHKDKIMVKPQLLNLQNSYKLGLQNIHKGEGVKNTKKEDNYSIAEMKKYSIGDRIKDINWKVSAKYNELYVKKFENINDSEFSVIIDMNKKNYDLNPEGYMEEKLIESALSIIRNLQERNMTFNVYLNSDNLESYEIKCKRDFEELYYRMIMKDSIGSREIEDAFVSKLRESSLIIFTSKLTKHLIQSITAIYGYECKIIIYSFYFEEDLIEILEGFSIKLFSIEELFKEENLYESI